MKRLIFALPGDPDTRTGGYLYDKRLSAELRVLGWSIDLLRLPEVLANPAEVPEAERRLGAIPDGLPVMIDGLALGLLPEAAKALAERGPLIALVHHPLAEETGLTPGQVDRLRDLERAALRPAQAIVVTSPATARSLTRNYAVGAERITVALPGVDPAPLAEGTGSPFTLLSVGSLTRRKGQAVLLRALEQVSFVDFQLFLAGSPKREPEEAKRLQILAEDHRHSPRINFAGEVDEGKLAQLYRAADLFVLPSFHEGYGMVLTESLAHGVPVVATTAGAIPETLPPGTARLVPPGDHAALAATLETLMTEPLDYAALRTEALAVRDHLPRWPETGLRVSRLLERLL
ncbi:glycosyltransferase family 4 protein [Algihabitans albus]|uniref:glycosyltransferase family 4 protein n=1 Tax=Algihabitans albus TaxID=2164067 RepID=UPI000E5C9221|nr:glycosyltransferase family 4 protein [Algihabitans albus]